MSQFFRERINPIDYMKAQGWPTDHITYDPKMRKGEYSIIRGSTHDGTLMFTYELLNDALYRLPLKASFYKPRQAEYEAAPEAVRYIVGPLRRAVVYGMVSLPCSKTRQYRGQRERVRIPVRMVCSSDTPGAQHE